MRTARTRLEQIDGAQQEIVEIQGVRLAEGRDVAAVDLGDLLLAAVPAGRSGHLLGRFHPVLRVGDPRQRRSGLDEAVVDVQILQRLLDDAELIGGVVDHEIAGEPDRRRLAAKQPRAQRMERRDPHAAAVLADQRHDPQAHLFRRLVGERDREDLPRLGAAVGDEVRRTARDDARLAGACAGEDQQRTADVQDGFALFGVEGFEELHRCQGLGTGG